MATVNRTAKVGATRSFTFYVLPYRVPLTVTVWLTADQITRTGAEISNTYLGPRNLQGGTELTPEMYIAGSITTYKYNQTTVYPDAATGLLFNGDDLLDTTGYSSNLEFRTGSTPGSSVLNASQGSGVGNVGLRFYAPEMQPTQSACLIMLASTYNTQYSLDDIQTLADLSPLAKAFLTDVMFYPTPVGGWTKGHPSTDEFGEYIGYDGITLYNETCVRPVIRFGVSSQTEGAEYQAAADLVRALLNPRQDDHVEFVEFDPSPEPVTNTDPYTPGGTSEPGGGEGTFNFNSDPVPLPDLPILTADDGGFFNVYTPTTAELRSFSSWLWGGGFDPAQLPKLYADPMTAIISCGYVPFAINSDPATLAFGGISSGVASHIATEGVKRISFGYIDVPRRWDAYVDFDPYTKIEIYLPFIGVRQLSTNECMGKRLYLDYVVEIASGSCVAFIRCDDKVLYTFAGNCLTPVPVTAAKHGDLFAASLQALGVAASVGQGAAGSASGIVGAASSIASTVRDIVYTQIERAGSLASSAGSLGVRRAYLVYTVPRLCVPADQNEFSGYPSFETVTLGDLQGYTEVESIHLTNVPATENEKAEIVELLKAGVIM